MDPINFICFSCEHFGKPNGSGCRAFPDGIPYGYPPNNKHSKPLKGQKNDLVYTLIDYKQLRGEELLYYFTTYHPDKDYSSIVALLPIATGWDMDKAYKLLERSIAENKKFETFYPEFDQNNNSQKEFVGEIDDGGLFLV